MEASQSPEPTPEPSPPPKPARVFLSPEVVEIHVRNGQPVDGSKAKMIHLMNQVFNHDPEIARDGDW